MEYVVKESFATNPAVQVKIVREQQEVRVLISNIEVLRAQALSGDRAEVVRLDLRPVGLDVMGDMKGLRAGGTVLSHNTVRGSGVAFAFGNE